MVRWYWIYQKKTKTQNPNSCCKKNQWWAIANLFIHVRHMSDTQAEKEEHDEKILKLLGKRYGVYFSKLSNATFAWWKKSIILNPSDKLLNWISAIFIIQKKQNKKTSLLSATNTFFQCKKKNKKNKNKKLFLLPAK